MCGQLYFFCPCLFENQWDVGKDEAYIKTKRELFNRRKGL